MWDGSLARPTSVQVETLLGEAANCRLLARNLEGRLEKDFVHKLADVFEELARLRLKHPNMDDAHSHRAITPEDLEHLI